MSGAASKIPVGEVMVRAWRFLEENRAPLARALLPAFLALFAIEALMVSQALPDNAAVTAGSLLAKALVFVVFAITAHRVSLLGPRAVPRRGISRWGWRETRFAGWLLAVYAAAVAAIAGPAMVGLTVAAAGEPVASDSRFWPMVLAFAAMMAGLYVMARLLMLFPATAVDHRPGLSWAWRATTGNGWRVFFACIGLPGLVLAGVSGAVGLALIPVAGQSAAALAAQPVVAVGWAWNVAILSYCYRELAGVDELVPGEPRAA